MTNPHANARLEAFCDGVFAIALTLLILEVKLPSTESIANTAELWRALRHLDSIGIRVHPELLHHPDHVGESSCGAEARHEIIASFIYANGFLLLSVVAIPFTAGCWIILEDGSCGTRRGPLQWRPGDDGDRLDVIGTAALRDRLTTDEAAAATMRESRERRIPHSSSIRCSRSRHCGFL